MIDPREQPPNAEDWPRCNLPEPAGRDELPPATLEPAISGVVVRLLASVLAGGFIFGAWVVAGCKSAPSAAVSAEMCADSGKRFEGHWQRVVETLLAMLAGSAIKG